MSPYHLFRICVALALLISVTSGRALSYDQLDEEDGDMLLSSSENDGKTGATAFGRLVILFSSLQTNAILNPSYPTDSI